MVGRRSSSMAFPLCDGRPFDQLEEQHRIDVNGLENLQRELVPAQPDHRRVDVAGHVKVAEQVAAQRDVGEHQPVAVAQRLVVADDLEPLLAVRPDLSQPTGERDLHAASLCIRGRNVAAMWRLSGSGILAIIALAALRCGDLLPDEARLSGVRGPSLNHCVPAGAFRASIADGINPGTSPQRKYGPKFQRARPTHFWAPRTFSTISGMCRPDAAIASRWMRKQASNSALSGGGRAFARFHGIAR